MKMAQARLTQGAYNTAVIAASSSGTLGVTLTHNAGSDWYIERYRLNYDASVPLQAGSFFQLYDSQRNRYFVSGYNTLGAFATPRSGTGVLAAPTLIWNTLETPIVLSSGQTIQLFIWTGAGYTFAVGALGLSMDGYQLV